MTPKAVHDFELEKDMSFDGATFYEEHPIERLKIHIRNTGGKIVRSDASLDGMATVTWESQEGKFNAWCLWPDMEIKVNWKKVL